MHSERAPFFLKLAAWGGVVFLHFPILIIAAYAFNTEDAAFSFPPQGLRPLPRCGDETFSAKTPFRCYCCCPLRCRVLSLVWRY